MWDNDKQYRVDGNWNPEIRYRIYLLRYQPNYEYEWANRGLHCYRHPVNVYEMPGCFCYVRLKHYGYLTKEIQKAKYERYTTLDPNGVFELKEQYESILKENPTLEKF